MIARTWHGMVPTPKKEAYYKYLRKTGLRDYCSIKGNLGLQVLQRDEQNTTHFFLITFWDSIESIKEFAGEQFAKARYYPEDREYLLELEPLVEHFEVLEMTQTPDGAKYERMNEVINTTLAHALEGYNSHLSGRVVLEGLTAEVAGKSLPCAPNTIWQQIGHILFWQERFIAHIKGQKLANVPDVESGWPNSSSPSGQAELDEVIGSILGGIDEVRSLLNRGRRLSHPSNYDSGYDVITSMATHLSYHLGQIMVMRRMLGDYPPPSGGYVW